MKGFKKMGLMFMAMVIALVGIGVGYASWTDTLTITGTVNTGSVELEVVEYSGTKVYKVPGVQNEIVVQDWEGNWTAGAPFPTPPAGGTLVAFSGARPGGADEKDVVMKWWNLFPSVWFEANVVFHYVGSIPAKVNDIDIDWWGDIDGDWVTPLGANGNITLEMTIVESLDASRVDDVVEEGYQLHYSDHVLVEVRIHIPQDDVYMNREGGGSIDIEVIQWNKYAD